MKIDYEYEISEERIRVYLEINKATRKMYKIVAQPQPTVGLIIGTFAAVPYVHLALEAWKRNYREIPVLVHDDSSPKYEELRVLCASYGASFLSNSKRGRWSVGDMSTYVDGLDWARERKLDLLESE
jgi:hypothetical protein